MKGTRIPVTPIISTIVPSLKGSCESVKSLLNMCKDLLETDSKFTLDAMNSEGVVLRIKEKSSSGRGCKWSKDGLKKDQILLKIAGNDIGPHVHGEADHQV